MASVIADDYEEDLSVRNGIMILLCVFFPYLFPFFMLYRIIKHRHYPHKKISDLKLMAVFLLFVLSLLFAVAVSMERDPVLIIFVCAITFLPSMIMFGVASNKSNKINERYNHYRELITQNSIKFIEEMAQATGHRPLVVRNELKHMIHNNLLSGIEIHGNQIIRLDNKWAGMVSHPQTNKPENKGDPSRAPKPKTIECHGCGASTTIMEGETTKCEYCDSIIS
ncbi:hypothetical protein [Paenibacillus mesotrionivorans]|uniref:Uncharacterized protein n=1 Tax=Paenibacillus mesotrionivorans TaxID=3160968 RepID=A0ACC7P0H6_9BACL